MIIFNTFISTDFIGAMAILGGLITCLIVLLIELTGNTY